MLKALLTVGFMAMVGFVAMVLLVAEGERQNAERDYYAKQ
jgi:hypothetical protein